MLEAKFSPRKNKQLYIWNYFNLKVLNTTQRGKYSRPYIISFPYFTSS